MFVYVVPGLFHFTEAIRSTYVHIEERILYLLQLFLIFRGFFWAWVGFYF